MNEETESCYKCGAEVKRGNLSTHANWHNMMDLHIHAPDHNLRADVAALTKRVDGLGNRVHLIERRTDFKGHVF